MKNGRPTGQATIIKLTVRVARLKFDALEAQEFGPKALACRDAFVEQGLCRAEVDRRMALVRRSFKWAVEEDLTDEQRAELKAWRKAHRFALNWLRHSAATKLRREIELEAVRVVLGHSDSDATTIYAERGVESARRAMEKLGGSCAAGTTLDTPGDHSATPRAGGRL